MSTSGERSIEQDEAGAGGQRRAHGGLGAGLAAQEERELVGRRRRQHGRLELQHLPFAVGVLDGGEVGAGEQRQLGGGGERALVELDADLAGAVEREVKVAGSGSRVTPVTAGATAIAFNRKLEASGER